MRTLLYKRDGSATGGRRKERSGWAYPSFSAILR